MSRCSSARTAATLTLIGALTSCGLLRPGPDADDAAVVVRYRHVQTCADLLGARGQYFVYRILHVDNRRTEPFTFEPSSLRFPSATTSDTVPITTVPEFSDLEVAPGSAAATTDVYLVQSAAPGRPPRAPVPLTYDDAGVRMVLEPGAPVYDEDSGCVDYST